jgi:hypothetical protein
MSGEEPRATILTSVAVDIGDGYGALVILADAAMEGREIEIEDADARRQHAVVHRVGPGDGRVWGAVFPSLPAGGYTVLSAGEPISSVEVSSGAVTQT